jgi:AraC-like DNA-binding protein
MSMTGCSVEQFADPETRIPRSIVSRLLEIAVDTSGDPAIGLRASELAEAHDLDVLEYAARSAPTLGDALHCVGRYAQLMDDALEMRLDHENDRAVMRFRVRAGVVQPAAANDFVVGTALSFSRRNAAYYEPPLEVHLAHPPTSYASEYERAFGTKVRFNAASNAVVISKARLATPMLRANPAIAHAFEQHARKLLVEVQKADGLSGKIRRLLLDTLRRGPVSMNAVARKEAMAVATMRRRLRDEGTTFADLLEEVRSDLAAQYLRDSSLTLTEIAFLLGYSNVTSFTRAFQRWTHMTPGAYRERERGGHIVKPLPPAPMFENASR